MKIKVNNLTKFKKVDIPYIKKVLAYACKKMPNKFELSELSIALLEKKTIKKINTYYRGVAEVTDILSFEDPPEILICWDIIEQQAKAHKTTLKQELALLLIHGWLHILGYDHQTNSQNKEMKKKQDNILKEFLKLSV